MFNWKGDQYVVHNSCRFVGFMASWHGYLLYYRRLYSHSSCNSNNRGNPDNLLFIYVCRPRGGLIFPAFLYIVYSSFSLIDNDISRNNQNYCHDLWHCHHRVIGHGIIPVFLEGYFMPPINEVYNKYKELIKGTVIIRLHGPDRSGIEKISGGNWNQIYINRDAELKKIIEMLSSLLSRDVNIYINVNNHFEGSAPLTIEKIEELLQHNS